MIDIRKQVKEREEFEKQLFAETDGLDVPQEVLKLYKLRKIISKAWIPLGISRDEAVDCLLWAVGEDVAQLNFGLWPERIMDRTGIKFDPAKTPVYQIFQMVGKKWIKEKPLLII